MTTMEEQQVRAERSAAPRTNVHIAGLGRSTAWAHRALRSRGVPSTELSDQACLLHVFIDSATLEHHGPDRSYRPYLYLTGELRAVVPDPEATDQPAWPHGISAITFVPATGETVCGFYEFDDEQLVSLVRKGYFWSGFEAPATITGFEWELPATVDLGIVDPVNDLDVPLVSTSVHDISSLEVDLANSGYDLASYFPDRSEQLAVSAQPAREMGVKSRDDEFDNLFAGESPAPVDQPHNGTPAPQRSSLTQLVADLEAEPQAADQLARALNAVDQETESDLAAFQREQAAGRVESVEDLFDQYVKTVLDAQEQPQAADTEDEADVDEGEKDQRVERPAAELHDTGLVDFDEPVAAPETKQLPAARRTYVEPEPVEEHDDWQLG